MSDNSWLRMIEDDPEHSARYAERFRTIAAEGRDLDGEARFVDAMVPRGAKILDAGCGPGRVGGRLAELGHHVVGVDIDPTLIDVATADHPGPIWLVRDLATLDLAAEDLPAEFDVIVSAGNVVTFLDPTTRRAALNRMSAHLAGDGRLVVGFGADRGYEFDDFFADAASAGLHVSLRLSTWDLWPFEPTSTFLVAVMTSGARTLATT